ncbi:hypothetical protein [Campylobacter geochelonis]|uniref:hypothetical protein n=1 Tax=Campylobacter geochelonis TaxID=1780362 RepID=UPI0007709BD6|nr:hypothetical protein [Campylobacter geochelonis]CZE50666.1 Uncharacterised protein [Campylobacter geochelonis]
MIKNSRELFKILAALEQTEFEIRKNEADREKLLKKMENLQQKLRLNFSKKIVDKPVPNGF